MDHAQTIAHYARFELVRVLAKGSFGIAALMRDPSSGELVVRKTVSLRSLSSRARKQALTEVDVLRQVCRGAHPFICRFLCAQLGGNELHMFLEYCAGGDLASMLAARAQPLDENAVLDIFAQLCVAVQHIHAQRVLHRDIKAQNVFLAADGSVRLGGMHSHSKKMVHFLIRLSYYSYTRPPRDFRSAPPRRLWHFARAGRHGRAGTDHPRNAALARARAVRGAPV